MKKRIHIKSFRVPAHTRNYNVSLKPIRISTKSDITRLVKIGNDKSIPEKERLAFLSNSLAGTYSGPNGKIKVSLAKPGIKNGFFKVEGTWAGKTISEKNKPGRDVVYAIKNVLFSKKFVNPNLKKENKSAVKKVQILKDKDINTKLYHIVKGKIVLYKSSKNPDQVAVFKGKEQMSKKFFKMYGSRDHIKKARSYIKGVGLSKTDIRNYKILVLNSESYKYGYRAY